MTHRTLAPPRSRIAIRHAILGRARRQAGASGREVKGDRGAGGQRRHREMPSLDVVTGRLGGRRHLPGVGILAHRLLTSGARGKALAARIDTRPVDNSRFWPKHPLAVESAIVSAPPVVSRSELRAQRTDGKDQGLRGDIQGMRAVAVLLVLLSHGGIAGLAGGYVGVDVFFVISGFLITGILVREVRTRGQVSIAEFYARRARRILPAATVTLAAVALASAFMLRTNRVEEVLDHVRWSALFAANIWSAKSGSDYFSEEGFVSPVQHYWSLAVEEQFYVVWPALIAIVIALGRKRVASAVAGMQDAEAASARFRLRQVTLVLAALSVVSLAWSVWQTAHNPTSAYFSTLTRGWELGIGSLLALTAHAWERLGPGLKAAASWTGLGMIAVAAVTYSDTTPFPGYHALLPVLGSALVIGGGIGGPRQGARLLLDTRLMRWFGDISYSLYLWHWPFLILPALYAARALTFAERLALMAASVGAAYLSYRFVETPVRRHRGLATSRRSSLAMWPVAVASVIAVGMTSSAASAALTVGDGPTTAAVTSIRDASLASDRVRLAAVQAKSHGDLPATLHPSLEGLLDDVSRLPASCGGGQRRDVARANACPIGDPDGPRTVVLFGDSHMMMWLRPLEDIAERRGWRVIAFQKDGCFPLAATLWRTDTRRAYTECDAWRENAIGQMGAIDPALVITTGYTGYLLATADRSGPLDDADKYTASRPAILELTRRLRRLAPVVVIGGVPTLTKPAADCLGSTRSHLGSCAAAPDRATVEINAAMRDAARATTSTYVDPLPWMCADGVCPVVQGDTIVYRDAHHITATFARSLTPELDAAIPALESSN